MRWLYGIWIALIALCLSPFAVLTWVDWFADKHGCIVTENATFPCIVDGYDWGPTLTGWSLSGWLLIVTLPLAALLTGGLALTAIIHFILRRRRAAKR